MENINAIHNPADYYVCPVTGRSSEYLPVLKQNKKLLGLFQSDHPNYDKYRRSLAIKHPTKSISIEYCWSEPDNIGNLNINEMIYLKTQRLPLYVDKAYVGFVAKKGKLYQITHGDRIPTPGGNYPWEGSYLVKRIA